MIRERELARRIKTRAAELGFDLCGITTLGPAETSAQFEAWLAQGYAGDMAYLERGAEKRRDTRLPYEGMKSAIVVAMNYGGTAAPGPVARYARGDDYHDVMVDRLNELLAWIGGDYCAPVRGKPYVDTGPILERELAQRAGLGWFGKNTNLLNPRLGSFFFIGSLLVDLELPADEPFASDHCGTCTRCLDACPTSAFPEARVLDATRCISYLTIESKGPIAETLQAAVGEHLYGCDVCQEVCPFNIKFSRDATEPAFEAREVIVGKNARMLATEVLAMDDEEFRAAFRKSPMKRAKLSGLQRNARAVLDNSGHSGMAPHSKASLASPTAETA